MRIAFLLHQFPAVSETFILRQIVGLIEMGHDVRIYAEYACEDGLLQPDFARYDLAQRTTYLRVPSESGRYELPVWPIWGSVWPPDTGERIRNSGRLWHSLPKFARCLARCPRLTQQVLNSRHYGDQATSLSALHRLSALASENHRFDALHAHFGPVGMSFRFARRLWQAPLVVSFHGYDFSMWPLSREINAYEHLFEEADIVTVHSNYAEDRLRALGCPPQVLRRLECGVDLEEFAFRARNPPRDRPVRLLTVGRLVEKKGLDFSIRAVAQLLREGHDLRYEIIGDGPLRAKLTQLTNELGATSRIEFAGARETDYVRKTMDQCDIFLLASVTAANGDTEGAPVSLLEAAASGMPVVATRHAGIPEVVLDNESGILVPERDAVALADALRVLISNPQMWPAMGQRGRAFVQEKHDINALNRRLVALYQEAAEGFPRSVPRLSKSATQPAATSQD